MMYPQKSICYVTLAACHGDVASGYASSLATRKTCSWSFFESINIFNVRGRMERILTQQVQENPAVRERLLLEALRLFTSRGYAATTVREIVESAGVTKPVLYYYFGSKEGLYLEIMEGISRTFELRINELQLLSGSVRARLLHFFAGIFRGAHENLAAVKLAYSIYFGPPQGAPFIDFNQFFDRTLEIVGNLIAEGIERGEILPVDRKTLTWALVGCHNTILEEQVCRQSPRLDCEALMKVINMILDGVIPAVVNKEE
jgi:AcrR family transcriptional regulator